MDKATLIIDGIIEIRGLGNVDLCLRPGNWYEQTGAPRPVSAAESAMINRHDFLIPLVQSAVMTDSSEPPGKIAELFHYWISNFSTSNLLRYDTPIDTAIRLINWLWVFHFGLLEISPRERVRLLGIIRIQLEYVSAWRSLGGNHLVLEALSNYLLYNAFPILPRSRHGIRWSRDTLVTELRKQTAEDGVHTEQSSFYHHAVSTHFLKFFLMARAVDDPLPAWAHDRFARMLEYIHDTTKPDLTHPVLGDGELLVTDDREHWESKSLLVARSQLYRRPICTAFLAAVNDASIWMMGEDPASIPCTDKPPPSRVFEESGAAVFRDSTRYLYFDAGAFGHPELPHHGHADALSIEFSNRQANIFIDPGGYGYYDDEFRRFFRSTSAHNTVVIDEKSQSHLYGVFGYGRLANVSLDAHELTDEFDYVAGSHDGYSPIQHHREVFFRKGSMPYLLVIDHLIGHGNHDGMVLYHLSPDVAIDESFKIRSGNGDTTLFTAAISNTALSQRLVTGRKKPSYQGWVSTQTGVVVAAPTWELCFNLRNPVWVATVIAENGIIESITHSESDMSLKIAGQKTDTYKYSNATRPSTVLDGVQERL